MLCKAKTTIACLAVGGALLQGCDARSGDAGTPEAAAQTDGGYTFASTAGDAVTFGAAGGEFSFGSGAGGVSYSSAAPNLSPATSAVPASSVDSPSETSDVSESGASDTPTPSTSEGATDESESIDTPGTIGGADRGVVFGPEAYMGFWEGPDPDGFSYRWVRRIAYEPPYMMVRTYVDEIDGVTGTPRNCFGEFGNRHIVEDLGGGTLRGVTDDDATENYREYELRDGNIIYSKYGDGGVLERRETWVPALEGLAAVDLPVCRASDS